MTSNNPNAWPKHYQWRPDYPQIARSKSKQTYNKPWTCKPDAEMAWPQDTNIKKQYRDRRDVQERLLGPTRYGPDGTLRCKGYMVKGKKVRIGPVQTWADTDSITETAQYRMKKKFENQFPHRYVPYYDKNELITATYDPGIKSYYSDKKVHVDRNWIPLETEHIQLLGEILLMVRRAYPEAKIEMTILLKKERENLPSGYFQSEWEIDSDNPRTLIAIRRFIVRELKGSGTGNDWRLDYLNLDSSRLEFKPDYLHYSY